MPRVSFFPLAVSEQRNHSRQSDGEGAGMTNPFKSASRPSRALPGQVYLSCHTREQFRPS